MFKNKLKLTKKLARLVAVSAIPLGIVAANSHASAMFRMVSNASTTRRPVVQQPRVVDFDLVHQFSDSELIADSEQLKRNPMKLNEVFSYACMFGKFKFARFLLEKGWVDVNQGAFDSKYYSALAGAIGCLVCSENFKCSLDDNLNFIRYLIEERKATLYGTPCGKNPLIFAFEGLATCGLRNPSEKPNTQVCEAIISVFEDLINRGMNVNDLDEHGKTLRRNLMNISLYQRSPYYELICQLVRNHGGLRYA